MAETPHVVNKARKVAFLHSGDLIDDWLDTIGVSLESFCNEMMGSWMFAYFQALSAAGTQSVLFCVSARVTAPSRFTHRPTGATICLLPPSRIYMFLWRWALKRDSQTALSHRTPDNVVSRVGTILLRALTSYFSTPLWSLAQELRRDECSALLVQEYEHARFDVCVLLGRLLRLPVFACFQGAPPPRRFVRPLRLLTVRACSGLIVAAGAEATRVAMDYRMPSAKIARIFNPLDLERWFPQERDEARKALGIPPDARVAVWHGVVEMRKGLDVLAEAWECICQSRHGSDLRLLLIGTGEDADKLRQLIDRRRLRGIWWKDGWVHDRAALRQYLACADVFVFPSRTEGFAMAPVEAMACGVPVVAASASGIPDLFNEGELSGGLVVPGDDASALAQALLRILDDKAWARTLGQRARKNAETRFSLEVIGKQLAAFLLPAQV